VYSFPLTNSQPQPKKSSDVLETRIATHDYVGQDDDELTFKKGDIVEVIPFADPDDDVCLNGDSHGATTTTTTGPNHPFFLFPCPAQEDGWMNGRMKGKEGLFPSNHTKPQ
jgi:hypothetical protein